MSQKQGHERKCQCCLISGWFIIFLLNHILGQSSQVSPTLGFCHHGRHSLLSLTLQLAPAGDQERVTGLQPHGAQGPGQVEGEVTMGQREDMVTLCGIVEE